jgi:ribosomal protein L7/L12/DNA-binding beta-propeller fold protein YncE
MPGDDIAGAFAPMINQALELAEVAQLLAAGNKIDAIKAYRDRTGAGLAAAKEAVENIEAGRSVASIAPGPSQFPEIAQLLAAGNKIGAIKAYRLRTGASLVIARDAVENIAAGRPAGPHLTGKQVAAAATTAASTGLMFGCMLTIGMIVTVLIVVTVVVRSVHRHVVEVVKPAWVPMIPPAKRATATPAAAPSFAQMVMEFGAEGIGAGQFKDARSIALDGNGHIYVGEYSDGRVQVFDADGKFLSTWSTGKDRALMSLAADRKGTVYAVNPGHILRFEGATGKPLGEVENAADEGDENYLDAFVALNGEIWAVAGNSDIVQLDTDGKIHKILKSREKTGENSLSFFRVIVLPTGEIYALDRGMGVFKFGADGRYINRFASSGRGKGHLLAARNIAADGKGRIYVSDSNLCIQVFDSDGAYIDSFGGNEVAFGMAIDDQNAIYACFRNRNKIRKYVPEK